MKTLSKKIKSVWGISEVGFSIMATMETSFLVFFLTDVAKLPLGIVGVITGSTALIDAISAIIAGIVIDKVNLKGGK
ncbi:MAG: MFS transporter, partial [Oscillospiraceae bacterium]|nr:MFS transporter [Oscillospiraceae bacterium]